MYLINFAEINFLRYSEYSRMIPIVLFLYFGLFRKYRFLFAELWIVQILLIMSHLIITLATLDILPKYNLYIYHMIGLVELIFIYSFYSRQIILAKLFKTIYYIIVVGYIINSIFFEPLMEHINAYGRSISSAFLFSICIYYLYYIYEQEEVQELKYDFVFWVNAGFIIYLATSWLTFLFSRKILSLELSSWFSAGWYLHSTADVLKNFIIAIGIIVVFSLKKKTTVS